MGILQRPLGRDGPRMVSLDMLLRVRNGCLKCARVDGPNVYREVVDPEFTGGREAVPALLHHEPLDRMEVGLDTTVRTPGREEVVVRGPDLPVVLVSGFPE